MIKKPVILDVKVLAATRIFQVESVALRFSNGEERNFERLRAQSYESVMIIPLLNHESILLVREYGVGLEDYYLSFPKGTVNQNEDILTAANRELMEETGYGAKKLIMWKSLSSSPSYTTRKMKMVLAMDLFQQRLMGDEPEMIEVVPWKLKDLDLLLEHEDFHEAKSIAALYMLKTYLKKELSC
jgi:ADP-ribose diphosphatase